MDDDMTEIIWAVSYCKQMLSPLPRGECTQSQCAQPKTEARHINPTKIMFKCPSCLNSLNLSVVSQVRCFMTISYKCSVKQAIIYCGSQMAKVSPLLQ